MVVRYPARWSSIKVSTIMFVLTFFIFRGTLYPAISSSKNYKLHSAIADSGGASVSSSNYRGDNSIGFPLGTNVATGKAYKIYGGALPTRNIIPEVTIVSCNDGQITPDNRPTLKWAYNDKDRDKQRYYQVQVSKDNFVTLDIDTGIVKSSDTSYTTPPLPMTESGITYKWRVRVNDGYDYSGWKVATSGFRVIPSKPEIPIIWAKTSPTGEDIPSRLWQDCGAPYMYWEYPGTGAQPIGYSYAWETPPDDKIDTTGFSYQTPEDLLTDGVHIFNLKAQNSAGNWGEIASFEIWIDRMPPVIGEPSPSNATIIATDRPSISIQASDDKSGVNPEGIVMKINKSSVAATYDSDTRSVIYLPSIPLSEGDNVVSLEVSDIVGNRSTPLVWSFIVDTKPPTGNIIINNEDAITNSVYVDLLLSAKDATSKVTGMILSNDGVFDTETWEAYKTRKENWQLPAISGTRKVFVKFKDAAGNESQIISDTIELIIIAPDTIITSGPSLVTKSRDALFTFKATLDDCIFRWKFDNEEWSEWSKDTLVIKKGLSEGNHYFSVQAAKDVNKNTKIDADEIDPIPSERTWTISEKGEIKPGLPKKKPFRFWKEE